MYFQKYALLRDSNVHMKDDQHSDLVMINTRFVVSVSYARVYIL